MSNSSIGPYQVPPLWARSDQGTMAIKGYSIFPRGPQTGASPSDCLMSYPGHSMGESYPSAEMQSVYFTAPAKWAEENLWYRKEKESNPEKGNSYYKKG